MVLQSVSAHHPPTWNYMLENGAFDRLKRWHTRTVFSVGTPETSLVYQLEVSNLARQVGLDTVSTILIPLKADHSSIPTCSMLHWQQRRCMIVISSHQNCRISTTARQLNAIITVVPRHCSTRGSHLTPMLQTGRLSGQQPFCSATCLRSPFGTLIRRSPGLFLQHCHRTLTG